LDEIANRGEPEITAERLPPLHLIASEPGLSLPNGTEPKGEESVKLYTHLNFGGNCEEAFRFYEKHLGGKIGMVLRQDQIPAQIGANAGAGSAVIHARLSIADVELIANDVRPDRFQPIRSSYLYLALDSPGEAQDVYQKLSEGGTVAMPLAETFFAPRFAQLRDKFGVLWTIICQKV
jgi:PhnB protein